MQTEKAKELLHNQVDEIKRLGGVTASSPIFQKWKRDTEVAIEQIFGKATRHLADFQAISFRCGIYYSGMDPNSDVIACRFGLERAAAILQSMREEIDKYGIGAGQQANRDSFARLIDLCGRFHLVARQLRERHDDRPTLDVEDEYDTQDLLHALLLLYFDDIRQEEWTPSYAGGAARMDFLLKQEGIVVELKKTRKGLGAKEVGEQLIVDIHKYQTHQDCRALLCFVYDPEGRIANARGMENDLNGDNNGITVRVVVAPSGT